MFRVHIITIAAMAGSWFLTSACTGEPVGPSGEENTVTHFRTRLSLYASYGSIQNGTSSKTIAARTTTVAWQCLGVADIWQSGLGGATQDTL